MALIRHTNFGGEPECPIRIRTSRSGSRARCCPPPASAAVAAWPPAGTSNGRQRAARTADGWRQTGDGVGGPAGHAPHGLPRPGWRRTRVPPFSLRSVTRIRDIWPTPQPGTTARPGLRPAATQPASSWPAADLQKRFAGYYAAIRDSSGQSQEDLLLWDPESSYPGPTNRRIR